MPSSRWHLTLLPCFPRQIRPPLSAHHSYIQNYIYSRGPSLTKSNKKVADKGSWKSFGWHAGDFCKCREYLFSGSQNYMHSASTKDRLSSDIMKTFRRMVLKQVSKPSGSTAAWLEAIKTCGLHNDLYASPWLELSFKLGKTMEEKTNHWFCKSIRFD